MTERISGNFLNLKRKRVTANRRELALLRTSLLKLAAPFQLRFSASPVTSLRLAAQVRSRAVVRRLEPAVKLPHRSSGAVVRLSHSQYPCAPCRNFFGTEVCKGTLHPVLERVEMHDPA